MQVWSLGREDPLEKDLATQSGILAWSFPWTEEPGRLQSTESQRVGMTEHALSCGLPFSTLGFCYVQIFKQRVLLPRELATHTSWAEQCMLSWTEFAAGPVKMKISSPVFNFFSALRFPFFLSFFFF